MCDLGLPRSHNEDYPKPYTEASMRGAVVTQTSSKYIFSKVQFLQRNGKKIQISKYMSSIRNKKVQRLTAPTSSSCGELVAFSHLVGPSGPPDPTPVPPGNSKGTSGKC